MNPVQARVAEFHMRTRPFSRKKKLRVDLHGVSLFGTGAEHTLIRWEWITHIEIDSGVVIRSRNAEVRFPDGAFGLRAVALKELLEKARSIDHRGEIIGRLNGTSISERA